MSLRRLVSAFNVGSNVRMQYAKFDRIDWSDLGTVRPMPTRLKSYPTGTFFSRVFPSKSLLIYRLAHIARVFFHPLLLHTLTRAVANTAPYLPSEGHGGSTRRLLHQLLRQACRDAHNLLPDNIRR
jgi:hypothetical protein